MIQWLRSFLRHRCGALTIVYSLHAHLNRGTQLRIGGDAFYWGLGFLPRYRRRHHGLVRRPDRPVGRRAPRPRGGLPPRAAIALSLAGPPRLKEGSPPTSSPEGSDLCVHTPDIASKIADALSRGFAPTGGPRGGWRRPADLNNVEEIRPPRTNAASFHTLEGNRFQEAAAEQAAYWGPLPVSCSIPGYSACWECLTPGQ
jgi:hypothetical protein